MLTSYMKGMHINNTQFALLEASEDFMVTALVLISGVVTDRIGGASKIASWHNILPNLQLIFFKKRQYCTEISSTLLDPY